MGKIYYLLPTNLIHIIFYNYDNVISNKNIMSINIYIESYTIIHNNQ